MSGSNSVGGATSGAGTAGAAAGGGSGHSSGSSPAPSGSSGGGGGGGARGAPIGLLSGVERLQIHSENNGMAGGGVAVGGGAISRTSANNNHHTSSVAAGGGATVNNHHLSNVSMNHDGSSVSGSHSLTEDFACGDPNAPTKHDFMVSFLVDARGGSMYGCRYSGVKVSDNQSKQMASGPVYIQKFITCIVQ